MKSKKSTAGRAIITIITLFGGGLASVVYYRYRRDIHRARERISADSAVVVTPCGPIEYAVAGDGPPVLVVHGAGGGFDQGMDFSEPLLQSGFRVIAMSRFGYLRTPVPADASAAAQADAHACLLDTLGISRAAVVGASAGAPSSVQFALRHPDRVTALVLLVPALYPMQAERTPEGAMPKQSSGETALLFDTALKSDFLFWLALRILHRTVTRAILATPPPVLEYASAEERARVELVLEHILPVSARRLGLKNDALIVSSLPPYPLERISAPTLIMSVADDLFGTDDGARYSAEHIRAARFIRYQHGGHLWVGHQSELVDEIVTFLRSTGKQVAPPGRL